MPLPYDPMRISIIIPALNEAKVLPGTLRTVRQVSSDADVWVVDGGSTDETAAIARDYGASVRTTRRGRAVQMNAGADAASGDVLLFLHADTQLPPDGMMAIRSALRDPAATAGVFRLRFDDDTPMLRMYAASTRLPWIRLAFGDRALFVERATFQAVGGFPSWPIFEDLELARRLHRRGGFRFLDSAVTTSARRFRQNGTVRQQLRNVYLWTRYCAGTSPDALAHLYAYDDARRGASNDSGTTA